DPRPPPDHTHARFDHLSEADRSVTAQVEYLEARPSTARQDTAGDVVHMNEAARGFHGSNAHFISDANRVEQALHRRPVVRAWSVDNTEAQDRDRRQFEAQPQALLGDDLRQGIFGFHRGDVDRAAFELHLVVFDVTVNPFARREDELAGAALLRGGGQIECAGDV